MRHPRPNFILIAVFAALAAASMLGCRHTLSQVPWAGPEHAMNVLAQRQQALRTVSAQGTLRLRRPDGQSVTLDVVLLAAGSDHLRLRAWKFSQAVFDLTLLPDGLWLWSGRESPDETAQLTAPQVAEIWSVLTGAAFDDRLTIDRIGPRTLQAHAPLAAGKCILQIDRATLTVRGFRFLDDRGQIRQTLSLDDYRLSSGLPWPRRILATGPEGRIALNMDQVEINGELAAGAFVPPASAVKQP